MSLANPPSAALGEMDLSNQMTIVLPLAAGAAWRLAQASASEDGVLLGSPIADAHFRQSRNSME